ncbi:MAG: hypothetical protein IH968_03875 [Gemmatimonadetes bacterium]|nr:hypothetical protein [Gemmatimonadota bacterium]
MLGRNPGFRGTRKEARPDYAAPARQPHEGSSRVLYDSKPTLDESLYREARELLTAEFEYWADRMLRTRVFWPPR